MRGACGCRNKKQREGKKRDISVGDYIANNLSSDMCSVHGLTHQHPTKHLSGIPHQDEPRSHGRRALIADSGVAERVCGENAESARENRLFGETAQTNYCSSSRACLLQHLPPSLFSAVPVNVRMSLYNEQELADHKRYSEI